MDKSPLLKIAMSAAAIIIFAVLPGMAIWLSKRIKGERRKAVALLLDVTGNVAGGLFLIFLLSIWYMPPRRRSEIVVILLIGFSKFIMAWPSYRLWRKFKRHRKWHGDAVEAG
jgi:hypothetical protein